MRQPNNQQDTMTMTAEQNTLPLNAEQPLTAPAEFGKKLRAQTMAVKLRRKKWGISKKLTAVQVELAADQFHAERSRISASKKLIDSRSKKFRACTSTISAAVQYWQDMTVPYPELGVRLMRKDKLDQFNQQLTALKAELAQAVIELQASYQALKDESQVSLGELFNESDYPTAQSLAELFALDWEFPSLQPDQLLKQLNPALYEAEQKRIAARFDEAVKLAEEAFIAEFTSLVSNLAERLQMGEDGKPKMFCESTVTGLSDFFGRFKELNVGNNAELDALVGEAQQLVAGDSHALAKTLRKDLTQRQHLQQSLSELSVKLEANLVQKPARKMSLLEDFGDEDQASEQPAEHAA